MAAIGGGCPRRRRSRDQHLRNKPLHLLVSQRIQRRWNCRRTVRHVVPRGRPSSPWLGRRLKRTPGTTEASYPGKAARPGRGANPRPCRSPKTVTEPAPVTAGRHICGSPCHDKTMQSTATRCRIAMSHRIPNPGQPQIVIPWHGPAARLPGPVGHTCCRPGHERSSRQAPPPGHRHRCWTGPRQSVGRQSAQRTSSAPTRGPSVGWSRTCRSRAGGGRSALPVTARTGVRSRAAARGRDPGRGW
jgi:hypothetical protein